VRVHLRIALSKFVAVAVFGALIGTGSAALVAAPASAAVGYNVFVGYADTLRPNAATFPTPFDTGPGITNEGRASTNGDLDSGAIRVVNSSAVTETVNSVIAHVGGNTFDLWPHNIVLASFDQLVFDETVANNFDSSDVPGITCTPDGIIPTVDVTVDGVMTTYSDNGQVLNTGGIDPASCSDNPNESEQWVSIGAAPCPTGATLTLAPSSQNRTVGSTATMTANFSACGTPLSGATVQFGDFAGPNAGLTGTGTTDSNGNASFSYSSSLTGTDTWLAAVSNSGGQIFSNAVTVVWAKASPSLVTRPSGDTPVGGNASDNATLSGGQNPTGTITFNLYAPNQRGQCVSSIGTRTVTVHGNGTYNSGPVPVTQPGVYQWTADYSGDSQNDPASSPCGSEPINVTQQVMTGRAFAVAATGPLAIKPTPDTGNISTPSAGTHGSCVVGVPAPVIAGVLCASVTTSTSPVPNSTADAYTARLIVGPVLAPVLDVSVVRATSTTTCSGSSGSSSIASLTVNGTNVATAGAPPNTTIPVGPVTVILNEQIKTTTADGRALTVNAVHVIIGTENIYVSSATSDIHNCPGIGTQAG